MSKNADKIFTNAMTLAKAFDENFLELAAMLSDLNDKDIDRFRDFIKTSGVSRRKAYYLVKLDRTFRPLQIPQKTLKEIGWAKLKTIASHVTKQNVHELLDYAKTHTVKEVQAFVSGGAPEDNAHSVVMYFNDQNYQELIEKLIEHGAVKRGRNIEGKEQALISLINALKK